MSVLHSSKDFKRGGECSILSFPAYKTPDTFYFGALLSIHDKKVAPLGVTTGWPFVGLCCQTSTTPLNSQRSIAVSVGGRIVEIFCAGVMGFSEVGRIVFCPTDNIDDLTLTPAGSPIGIVRRFRMGGRCDIELFDQWESEEQMWRLTPPR